MDTMHPFWLLGVTFLIALVPIVAGLLTSYLKVSVVLTLLRSGLGAQQVPSGLVVMALSLAITFYVMTPVFTSMGKELSSVSTEELTRTPGLQALTRLEPAVLPLREFLKKHSGPRELKALVLIEEESIGSAGGKEEPEQLEEPPLRVLLISFVLTELKEAFAMGFLLLLPFLVIDLVVANLLVGLGMMMVSPVMIALPLKLLLFVVTDGWILLTRGLIESYRFVP